jgi:hypothetical protein
MKITLFSGLAVAVLFANVQAPVALGQGIPDGVILTGVLKDNPPGSLGPGIHTALVTYNRKLLVANILDIPQYGDTGWGDEAYAGIAIAKNGDVIIDRVCNFACNKAVRVTRAGNVVWEVNVADTFPPGAVDFAMDRDDNLYIETVDGSGSLGIRKINPNGTIAWTSFAVSSVLSSGNPRFFYLTSDQHLSCAGQVFLFGLFAVGKLVQIDSGTGNVLSQQAFPYIGTSQAGSGVNGAAGSPDGLHWIDTEEAVLTPPSGFRDTHSVVHATATATLSSFQCNGGYLRMRVGPDESIYLLRGNSGGPYDKLARFHPKSGVLANVLKIGAGVSPIYNLSNNTEEAYFTTSVFKPPAGLEHRLVKLSLVTGQSSFVVGSGLLENPKFVRGDSSGQPMATIMDQDGDNDGDGYTNFREVRLGYSPYDASSHPSGPRIYLWFDAANNDSLNLKIYDPDGIFDANGGITLSSLALFAQHPQLGEIDILPSLMPYLTSYTLSPDGTELTLAFGGYAFPEDLGYGITASVNDVQGAFAYDWHMTPQNW